MNGFVARGRASMLITLTSICALIAALLALQPAQALPAPRLPDDGASVSTVPVLSWPTNSRAVAYELQVSKSAAFSTTIVKETRETPSYVFIEDLAPGRYYWRYRGVRSNGTLMEPSQTWAFTRASQTAPVLAAPDQGVVLDFPDVAPTLRWDPVPSFGRYTVQWDDNAEFRSPKEATILGTAFTLPDLQPQDSQKEIFWRVKAEATVLKGVTTAWSQSRSFTVRWGSAPQELLTPANKLAADDAVDQPVFTWTPRAGAASYELQIALDDKFTTLVHPDTGIDYPSTTAEEPFVVQSTTYIAPTRYPAKSHWWRVRALDANGAPGPWYETSHFTRRWTQSHEPTGVTVSDPVARPDNVTVDRFVPIDEFEVTWDAVPDTTYYEVEVSTDLAFHSGIQRTVCRTPHNRFAPSYAGLYLDAGREDLCPINVPPSAMPPVYSSTYAGDGQFVTVSGSGAAKDSIVLLNFGTGDPDNGRYRVVAVTEDDPQTPQDEASFTVVLARSGAGDVEWQLLPGLVLAVADTYFIRVRAVHETVNGELMYSVWSDQANSPGAADPGNVPPGPAVTTPTEAGQGTTALNEPAALLSPATGSTWTDWPVLRWESVTDADAYLVAIAKDREFTNSILEDLDSLSPHFEYYVTRGTSFVPQTTLAENTAGGSYYWYVLPCTTYKLPEDNDCAAPDRDAILQSGRWSSFHKQSTGIATHDVEPAQAEPWVTLSWDDLDQSHAQPPTIGPGGFSRYELQITASTWQNATTVTTETARFSTAGLRLEPSTMYRWRVRAIDGGLLPLAWSEGDEFQLPSFSGPNALPTQNDQTGHPCLTWEAASLASGYEVEVFDGTDEDYPQSARVQRAATSYPSYCPSGLGGGTYSWRVRALHNGEAHSLWSTGAKDHTFTLAFSQPVITAPLPPVTPVPNPPAQVSVRKLRFDWTAVPGAASYMVELSRDNFWTVSGSATTVTNVWRPNDLEPGVHRWRVKALDADGNVLSISDSQEVSVSRLQVTGFLPVSGPTAGGTRVTFTGTGFAPNATATFDGQSATSGTHTGSTSFTVETPTHPAGEVEVIVTNPADDPEDAESYVALTLFTYVAPPQVTSLAPRSGPTSGGTTVTLTGTNFDAGATVEFDGVPAEMSTPRSATRLTVLSPRHAAGVVDVTVINEDGQQAATPSTFTYVAAPTVTEAQPTSGPTSGGTEVTIIGENLDPDATVDFDGLAGTVTKPHDRTSMIVTSPPHGPGRVDIRVTNEDGQVATAPMAFTYLAPPVINSFTPTSGSTLGGTSVTLNGDDFDSHTEVTVGGATATVTGRSGATITFTTPPHAAGLVDIVVINQDGQTSTATGQFRYIAPPSITTFTPQSGPAAGGTSVTVTGSGFDSQASVFFGGVQAQVTSRRGTTSLTVDTPEHAPGQVPVVVTNDDGQTATAPQNYTYIAGPAVSSLKPISGPAAGGTVVTITGTGFDPLATVTFGGTPCSVTSRTGTTQMSVVTPEHDAGRVSVVVTNPDGQSIVATEKYTYVAAPSLISVTPSSGTTGGGTVITLAGTDFDPNATVAIGGVQAKVATREGDTGITVTTPAHAPGPADVSVTNPDGQKSTSSGGFIYIKPPILNGLAPTSGPTAGGTILTVTGADFDPSAQVMIDAVAAQVTDRAGSTSITVSVPAHAAGEASVLVRNPDGQVTATAKFTYVAPPMITGVTPGSGATSGYTSVTISGAQFDSQARVSFDGVEATVTGRSGSAALTVLTPVHEAGTVDVTVSNPDGQTAVAQRAFAYVSAASAADTEATEPPWFVTAPRLKLVRLNLHVRWSRPTSPGAPSDNYRVLLKQSAGAYKTVHTGAQRHARIKVVRGRTYWVKIVPHSSAGWGQPGPAARRVVR
jgi:hypothetical protein